MPGWEKSGRNIGLSLPRGISAVRTDNELVITRRWLSDRAVLYLVVSVGLAVAIFFQGEAFRYLREHEQGWTAAAGWFFGFCPMVLSPIVFYLGLAESINRTVIRVSSDELSVTHGPLPLRRTKHVKAADVVRIFGRDRLRWGLSSLWLVFGIDYYQLVAVLRTRRKVVLLPEVDSPEQVHWVKNLIASHLRLYEQKQTP